jgi:hypothetical protein
VVLGVDHTENCVSRDAGRNGFRVEAAEAGEVPVGGDRVRQYIPLEEADDAGFERSLLSICCPIARPQQSPPGCSITPASRSSPVIAPVLMPTGYAKALQAPSRSPIGGICSATSEKLCRPSATGIASPACGAACQSASEGGPGISRDPDRPFRAAVQADRRTTGKCRIPCSAPISVRGGRMATRHRSDDKPHRD